MLLLSIVALLNSYIPTEYFHSVSYEKPIVRVITQERSFYSRSTQAKNYYYQSRWNGRFSAENFDTPAEKRELSAYKASAKKVVEMLPTSHTRSLQNVIIKNEPHPSRGMANGRKIILNTGRIDSQKELMAVMIHEMGHVVDLGQFVSRRKHEKSNFQDYGHPVYQDDPSVKFYELSWSNENDMKDLIDENRDFVSGYATSNPFEDFAESYLYYRLHGADFRQRMGHSTVLKQKYDFMKRSVFNGEEFQLDGVTHQTKDWIYDTTLLPYDARF